ncbi:MAG: imidazolonepropionase [Bryobacteraceae bacterium]|jgi:imidazolonepropionase
MPRRGIALGELTVIPDGAVLIRDGLIDEVGTSRRVEALKKARDADEISAVGRVVMPGFVDSHTHLVSGPARPYQYSLDAMPAEAYWKPLQQTSRYTIEAQCFRLLDEFIRHGTTTLEAKSGFGMNERGELKILRAHAALNRKIPMLVSTFMGTRWLPEGSSPDEYIHWMCEHMLPLIKRRRLAEFADIYCDSGMFSISQADRFLSAAGRLGFGLKMHTGQLANIGAIPEAIRLGVTSVDHLNNVNDRDIALLAECGVIATLLPGPVFFTGDGHYPPARKLIDEGAAVALATNYNPHTSQSQNMQMMISLACRQMGMTAAEAISAATINGAHALRRAGRVGSIERGKAADLAILDVGDYREIPYHFGVNLVYMTLKDGRVLCRRSNVQWPAA